MKRLIAILISINCLSSVYALTDIYEGVLDTEKETVSSSSSDEDTIAPNPASATFNLSSGDYNVYSRPKELYKTPEAKAFRQYGRFGTEGSNGSVGITVPIHTISCRDLQIPISLNYGGGGIRVAEEASWVGLGWDLSVGGCVNLVPAGQVDYIKREAQWSDYQALLSLNSADTFQKEADGDSYTVMGDLMHGMGERDFYHVNILGRSFLFFIDPQTENPTVIGEEKDVYSISRTGGDGWLIKDVLGYIYEFSAIEYAVHEGTGICRSAMYMTSIQTPEGITADFSYDTSYVRALPQGYQWYDAERTISSLEGGLTITYDVPRSGSGRMWGNAEITKPWLKSISTDNQTVTFELGDRTDYSGAKRLNRIKVTDITGASVAQYHFNYGTFSNSTVGGSFPDTSNHLMSDSQNKQRLKLLSFSEISSNGKDSLTHTFSYNEKYALPLKTSAAIDFWGYYNGQENQNVNTTLTDSRSLIPSLPDCTIGYTPAILMTQKEYVKPGACRFSHKEAILASTLRSITYPTGGRSEFTFEPHTFKSSPVFPTIGSAGFQDIQATVEDNNYPSTDYQPGPVTHKEVKLGNNARGSITVTFQSMGGKKLRDLQQAKASISAYPMASPDHKRIIITLDSCHNVNLDGTQHTETFYVMLDDVSYMLTANLPSAIQYGYGRVKGELKVRCIDSSIESGGAGLRIASIANYDTDGTLIGRRTFEYTNSDGTTSGRLIVEGRPMECRLKYLEHVISRDKYGEIASAIKSAFSVLRLTSSLANGPSITGVLSRGNVAYSRVTEKETDGSENLIRTTVNDYNVYTAEEKLPDLHLLSSFGGGEIAKTSIMDASGNTLRTVEYEYEKKTASTVKCNVQIEDQYYEYCSEFWTHRAPRYLLRIYPYHIYWRVLSKVNTKDYTPGGVVETVTDYSYNTKNHLKSEERTVMGGVGTKTSYKYAIDYTTSPFTTMCKDTYHMLGVPVEICRYETRNGVNTESQKLKFSYAFNPGKSAMLLMTSIMESVKGGAYSTREAFTYNDGGCLAGVTEDSAFKRTYLWSYNNTCPVAVIDGATFSEVNSWITSSLVNSLSKAKSQPENLLSQLRSKLWDKNVTVSTFTHKPLVGITTATAPNGYKTSYAYDGFNRLGSIKNNDGKTSQTFSYDYMSAQGANITACTMLDNIGSKSTKTVTWHDGLGRPIQTVTTGANTNDIPIVNAVEIDLYGNQLKEWLPFPVSATTAKVKKNNVAPLASSALSDSKPYTELTYDALGRVTRSATPGTVWHNASKGVATVYSTNAANSVKLYRADVGGTGITQSGMWAARSLSSVKTVDEDGLTLETFTDGAGHKVLERRGGNSDTYYVYNDAGQLRYVLQPMYADNPDNGLYAFEYRYDTRGNIVYKSVPGGGAETYTYDLGRRMTFMQDARLKERNLYRFFLYDSLGRKVIQGTSGACNTSTSLNPASYSGGATGFMSTGYSLPDTTRIRQVTLETVSYYDNYSFVNTLDTRLAKSSNVSAKGNETGMVVYNSGGGKAMSAIYYDIRGNVTSLRELTDFGTLRITDNSYNFTDQLLSSNMTEDGISLLTEITYDTKSGLLVSTDVTVNGVKQQTSKIAYDDWGRIKSVTRGEKGGVVNFQYNLHGNVTDISGPGLWQQINYNTGPGKALYNGSVSSMLWKMGADATIRGYKYTYNGCNWLTNAEYGEGSSLSSNRNRYSEKSTAFTKNGGVTEFARYGLKRDGTYGLVDDLDISYDGNRISSVADNAQQTTQMGSMDYPGGSTPSAVGYDSTGSMNKDASRGITDIEYDNSGNPVKITFSNGNMTWNTYSSNGVKLRSRHTASLLKPGITVNPPSDVVIAPGVQPVVSVVNYEYHGPVVYRNGKVYMVLFDGGYATTDDSGVAFHYYTRDYLGNNRAVVNGTNGEIEQTMAYYPYGGVIADLGTGNSVQPYKFGGKELISANGLNEYDFGARRYWQSVPMFTSIDPESEKFYWLSPYLYCANNPVNLVDLNGEEPSPYEAALMCGYVYHDENFRYYSDRLKITGWGVSERKVSISMNNTGKFENDLQSELFERTIDGVTEYAYAFAGSVSSRD